MKTKKGYKLFEMTPDGKLLLLFIGKNEETEMGKWIRAKNIPTKGFANRPGWHVGLVPDAPWLKGYNGTDVGYYKPRFKNGQRVWCEVECNITNDYNVEVLNLKKKCFIDKIPENGYYDFKEAGKGIWVITSDIKVNRIISEKERQDILKKLKYDEIASFKKYKIGFEKRMKLKM